MDIDGNYLSSAIVSQEKEIEKVYAYLDDAFKQIEDMKRKQDIYEKELIKIAKRTGYESNVIKEIKNKHVRKTFE